MTRTSKALRRLGVGVVAAATVLSVAPLLGATAANAAGTPLLVAADCTQQSTATTTTTQGNTNGVVSPTNPSNATGAGSGCMTQAQVNTTKTLTFTYTEGGAVVAGRNIDFTLVQPAQPPIPGTTQPSASFSASQPSGSSSFAGPAPTNFAGQGAQCTTDAAGKCSVSVTDSEAESIAVNAIERSTGAKAYELIDFRANSVAVARFDETGRTLVKPAGDAVTNPTPGRPVELTYTAFDSNGNCNTAAAATCTGAILASQAVTVKVNQAAYFTPNCTPRDASATSAPQRSTAGLPAVGTTPAQPSTGTLTTPDYRACSFTGTPVDDAQTAPLTSLGQSVTVVTDQFGQFTVTVVEGRDVEFDNNGISVVNVTLGVGTSSFTARTVSTGPLATSPSGTAANCPTTSSTTGNVAGGSGNTAGCNVQPLVFTTRDKALNGASVSLVRVDGGTPFATGTNQTPDRPQLTPIFVVQLKDQYGNLTLADGSANNDATLTKEGVGALQYCGTGANTPNVPCSGGGSNTVSTVSNTTNNDGTVTTILDVRGSFTDLAEQERFRSRTQDDINGNPIEGTQTLTADWVAPVTEYSLGTTTNGFAAGGAGNNFKTPGFDQSETDNAPSSVVTLQFYKQQAAAIAFTATPGTTVPVGTVVTLTATITDQNGQPLSNYNVSFFRGGTSNDCNNTATNGTGGNANGSLGTDRQGRAFFSFTCSTASTQNITLVVFDDKGAEIGRRTQTILFTGSSVQPTSSATPTARQNLTLTVRTPLIPAGSTATLVATGSANQLYQLRCYTRPSTTYVTSRSGSFDAAGNPVTFTLSLGRNTRCFIQYAVNSGTNASPSRAINVRTVLSLSTVRTAVRTYVFQGRNLPRVAGQLITLYRVDSRGQEIRTSNLVTDASGIFRVTRKFTGNGTFRFKVRTSTTLNNAAGVSNTITVTVR